MEFVAGQGRMKQRMRMRMRMRMTRRRLVVVDWRNGPRMVEEGHKHVPIKRRISLSRDGFQSSHQASVPG
jgi:hypothetical protein